MSTAEWQRVSAMSRAMRERIDKANQPPTPTKQGTAEVIPFPVNRQRRMVDAELKSVRHYDNDAAYRWLSRIAKQHGKRLTQLGVAPDRIEADVAALNAAFGIGDTAQQPISRGEPLALARTREPSMTLLGA